SAFLIDLTILLLGVSHIISKNNTHGRTSGKQQNAIAEGFYPDASQLHYTLSSKKYPIPDNYSVKTSWGCVKSCISASMAATNYRKAINKTSRLSGLLLFGLQLQTLRESQNRQYLINSTNLDKCTRQDLIKPAGHCSESAFDKHAKNVVAMIKEKFIQNSVFKYYEKDSILLKLLEYTVNSQNYYLSFGTDNAQKECDILNIVKIMDLNYISRDAYRSLAAIDYHLPHEHLVNIDSLEIVEDDGEDIEEDVEERSNNIDFNKVLNLVGAGGYQLVELSLELSILIAHI
ncbi:7975_t:CDS:2, partial [Dentiscutata heterogama]